jgi:hypothetical protein
MTTVVLFFTIIVAAIIIGIFIKGLQESDHDDYELYFGIGIYLATMYLIVYAAHFLIFAK